MRPQTAFLTILLAALLAITVIGVGTMSTQAEAENAPAIRSL